MQLSRKEPSFVLTVISASPAFFAVTTPFELTEATFELLERQVTLLSDAPEGRTFALRTASLPGVSVISSRFRETPVTLITTLTVQTEVKPPSTVVTVIFASPLPTALTSPS